MKKTIYLQQKTPMWHFQPNVSGCCLRATEVKPKLDKYLLAKFPNDKNLVKIGQTDALDYKLSFEVVGNAAPNRIVENENFPLFFANMGNQTERKSLILYSGNIKMNIFSLNDDLVQLISDNLKEFFATHSFGTRQDKGFGYFFPVGSDFNQAYGAKYKFSIIKDVPQGTQPNYEDLFKYIEYFHKLIRSGINMNGVYYKSLMYHYAKSLKLQWDKPSIRHHFELHNDVYKSICAQPPYDNGNSYSYVQHTRRGDKIVEYRNRNSMRTEYERCSTNERDNSNKLMFRDALGLASVQEWKAYGDTITIESDRNDFVRFKSPINYRPCINVYRDSIELVVYIHFDESGLKKLKDRTFTVHSKRNRNPLTNMKVYEKFSLEKYFTFIEEFYEECRNKNQKINQTPNEVNNNGHNNRNNGNNRYGGGYNNRYGGGNNNRNNNANVRVTPANYIDEIFNPRRRNFVKITE